MISDRLMRKRPPGDSPGGPACKARIICHSLSSNPEDPAANQTFQNPVIIRATASNHPQTNTYSYSLRSTANENIHLHSESFHQRRLNSKRRLKGFCENSDCKRFRTDQSPHITRIEVEKNRILVEENKVGGM